LGYTIAFDETRVLAQLLNTTDPWLVAGGVRLAFPRFLRVVDRLERKGLVVTAPGKMTLSNEGRRAAVRLGLRSARQITAAVKRARKRFSAIAKQRPQSVTAYDQGYMTVDSVFRRVELMVRLGDADLKRIVVLGDDDLLSIAICLCSKPEKVTVLEIDERVVDFIHTTAEALNLPVAAERLDLREPPAKRLQGRFHTFVTDPSETIDGLKMFLGRGLAMLRSGESHAGYFGLTTIEASTGKWSRVQGWLLRRYALAITHVLPQNAFYHNWPDILAQTGCFSAACIERRPAKEWFNSALVRLETVKGYRGRHVGRIRGHLFNDEEACGIAGVGNP
jgi:predicted methyltransferase